MSSPKRLPGRISLPGMLVMITVLCLAAVALLMPMTIGPRPAPGPATRAELTALATATMTYQTEYGAFPNAIDIIDLLRIYQGDNERKLLFISVAGKRPGKYSRDGWGTSIRIEGFPGASPRFISAGPDREFGTKDDLREGVTPPQ